MKSFGLFLIRNVTSVRWRSLILSLYSSLIDKYKTVNVLQDQRMTTGVNLVERSFIEQYVYLLFILDNHTQERGRTYFDKPGL